MVKLKTVKATHQPNWKTTITEECYTKKEIDQAIEQLKKEIKKLVENGGQIITDYDELCEMIERVFTK